MSNFTAESTEASIRSKGAKSEFKKFAVKDNAKIYSTVIAVFNTIKLDLALRTLCGLFIS